MKSRPHSEPVRADLVIPKPVLRSTHGYTIRRKGTSYTLTVEVKEWLRDMIKNHWYLYEHRELGGLHIAFHNREDAMLYKLVWH